MSNLSKPRIKLPDTAKVGEVIDVKATVVHVMETGNRRDAEGKSIPRNVVNSVTARFAGEVVFRATLGSGIAANPFISFAMRVPGPGKLEMTWADDEGKTLTETAELSVVE